jgi:acyl-CoA hydrolase
VRFSVERTHLGNTSVQYGVKAFGTRHHAQADDIIFQTKITFVAVDENGNKQTIKHAGHALQIDDADSPKMQDSAGS